MLIGSSRGSGQGDGPRTVRPGPISGLKIIGVNFQTLSRLRLLFVWPAARLRPTTPLLRVVGEPIQGAGSPGAGSPSVLASSAVGHRCWQPRSLNPSDGDAVFDVQKSLGFTSPGEHMAVTRPTETWFLAEVNAVDSRSRLSHGG